MSWNNWLSKELRIRNFVLSQIFQLTYNWRSNWSRQHDYTPQMNSHVPASLNETRTTRSQGVKRRCSLLRYLTHTREGQFLKTIVEAVRLVIYTIHTLLNCTKIYYVLRQNRFASFISDGLILKMNRLRIDRQTVRLRFVLSFPQISL